MMNLGGMKWYVFKDLNWTKNLSIVTISCDTDIMFANKAIVLLANQ